LFSSLEGGEREFDQDVRSLLATEYYHKVLQFDSLDILSFLPSLIELKIITDCTGFVGFGPSSLPLLKPLSLQLMIQSHSGEFYVDRPTNILSIYISSIKRMIFRDNKLI
jgi:hypothetical protein